MHRRNRPQHVLTAAFFRPTTDASCAWASARRTCIHNCQHVAQRPAWRAWCFRLAYPSLNTKVDSQPWAPASFSCCISSAPRRRRMSLPTYPRAWYLRASAWFITAVNWSSIGVNTTALRLDDAQPTPTISSIVVHQQVSWFCGPSTTAFVLLNGDVHTNLELGVRKVDIFSDEDASMTDTWRGRHADMNADWEAAVAGRLPVLLTGPASTTDDWIHRMQPRLALPVVEVACDADVKTTALDDAGTVVLHDVEHLRPADQQRLLQWLEEAPHRPQIVSTSSRALYPLVCAGRFSENLYYRLNSVYLDCTNPTIIDLGASLDEGGCNRGVPCGRTGKGRRPPARAFSPSRSSLDRTDPTRVDIVRVRNADRRRLDVGCDSAISVRRCASSERCRDSGRSGAAASPSPRQHDFPDATLQGASARSVPSPGATIRQSEPVPVTRTLEPPAARPRRTVFRGALAVNSRPTGARVSINGQSLGVTPLMVKSLPAGSRVVRVTAQGYHPWASAVRVVANQRNSVIVTLQRLPD